MKLDRFEILCWLGAGVVSLVLWGLILLAAVALGEAITGA